MRRSFNNGEVIQNDVNNIELLYFGKEGSFIYDELKSVFEVAIKNKTPFFINSCSMRNVGKTEMLVELAEKYQIFNMSGGCFSNEKLKPEKAKTKALYKDSDYTKELGHKPETIILIDEINESAVLELLDLGYIPIGFYR